MPSLFSELVTISLLCVSTTLRGCDLGVITFNLARVVRNDFLMKVTHGVLTKLKTNQVVPDTCGISFFTAIMCEVHRQPSRRMLTSAFDRVLE